MGFETNAIVSVFFEFNGDPEKMLEKLNEPN